MGSYLFKWPYPGANEVYVSGTFDDWGKTAKLDKVGETFEREVELPSADHKILYKFVVDDDWKTDEAAPKEDDGHFNVNNVLHPEQLKKKAVSSGPGAAFISSAAPTSTTAALAGGVPKDSKSAPGPATISSAAPDSTTAGLAGQVERTTSGDSVPGAFPETPSNEPESFGVAPIPASSGLGNPKPGEVSANTVDSTATTSKEAYDKAGQEGEKTFGVAPIPASSGVGNPQAGDVQASSVNDTATTSKEDYEKAGSSSLPLVGGIAAAAGIGAAGAAGAAAFSKGEDKKNLIPESSLPMGENAGKSADIGPTMSSAAPQSTTAALAAGVPLENKRQGMVIDPVDAPSDEVKKDVNAVDQELLSKVKPSEATGEPASAAAAQTSYHGLATTVPKPVEESMKEAHASPEAAADSSVVAEKSALEKELLAKVPTTDGAGEPAPTIAAATSPTAPAATSPKDASAPGTSTSAAAAVADGAGEEGNLEAPKTTAPVEKTEADATEYAPPKSSDAAPGVSPAAAAAISDGTEDPTLAEEPAVKMMNQNEAATAPSTEAPVASTTAPTSEVPKEKPGANLAETTSKPAAATTTGGTTSTPTSTTATPKKATESATSSPADGATKDKKKKHRVSAFFKKIFD